MIITTNTASFLGTGWAFPPAFSIESGSVELVHDVEDIYQSLQILLTTRLGERIMQPSYGCNLIDYQFEPVNNTFLGYLQDLVERAILFNEPRIVVGKVNITEPAAAELLEGILFISIDFVVARTNTRYNYVYPFYLREADRQIT